MHLYNLNIDKIVIHQIFQRAEDGKVIQPKKSSELTLFAESAMGAFISRVRDAIGEDSRAVQMEIADQSESSLVVVVNKMSNEKDENAFINHSYELAQKLTSSQHSRGIPGGILVIFSGMYGEPQRRCIGLIKADVYSAYEKLEDELTKRISLKFIEEVLLTPASKLYKTAAFFEKPIVNEESEDLNDKWAVYVSDNQISQSEGKASAQYFFSDFLGFQYRSTSAKTTKEFYDATTKFLAELDKPEEDKSDLYNALSIYLKVNTSPMISSSEFAETYFGEPELIDSYTGYMESMGLPREAFTKDIDFIKNRLSLRKVSFNNKIKLTAPSEIFKKLVDIESIEGDADETGERPQWTKIIVKDKIIQQE